MLFPWHASRSRVRWPLMPSGADAEQVGIGSIGLFRPDDAGQLITDKVFDHHYMRCFFEQTGPVLLKPGQQHPGLTCPQTLKCVGIHGIINAAFLKFRQKPFRTGIRGDNKRADRDARCIQQDHAASVSAHGNSPDIPGMKRRLLQCSPYDLAVGVPDFPAVPLGTAVSRPVHPYSG